MSVNKEGFGAFLDADNANLYEISADISNKTGNRKGFEFGTPEYDAEVQRQFLEGLPKAMQQAKYLREGFMQDPSIQAGMKFASEVAKKKREGKERIKRKILELRSSTSELALNAL